jgi:hypothetical protein
MAGIILARRDWFIAEVYFRQEHALEQVRSEPTNTRPFAAATMRAAAKGRQADPGSAPAAFDGFKTRRRRRWSR